MKTTPTPQASLPVTPSQASFPSAVSSALSPMFIGYEIRRGEAEAQAQAITRERTESRNFGRLAHAVHRAGRRVWSTDGRKPQTLHAVANHERNHVS